MNIESDLLRKKIREHLNSLADTISGGGCADFPDYKYQCGVIHGLALAERELLDLVEVQRKAREEDE